MKISVYITSFNKGNILDTNGSVIGEHNGIINFTIGQRKGIRISNKEPLYVLNIDAHKNEVIVGKYIDLAVNKIYIKDINLLGNLDEYKKNLYL